jgi:hypothetical protein
MSLGLICGRWQVLGVHSLVDCVDGGAAGAEGGWRCHCDVMLRVVSRGEVTTGRIADLYKGVVMLGQP